MPCVDLGFYLLTFQTEMNSNEIRTTVWPYKSECQDLLNDGHVSDGIYSILSWDTAKLFVVCDMNSGGWTVIQRRFDGSEDFYRDWEAYRLGFGNKMGEYWLGLENIHRLTKDSSEFSVYMEAFPGANPPSVSAHYTHFSVDDHASQFVLHVSGFSGTCGDAMETANGMAFTTYDNDNDAWGRGNCAAFYKGASWLAACHFANPNGHYFQLGEYSVTNTWGEGIHWRTCWNGRTSLKSTILKIRKNKNI